MKVIAIEHPHQFTQSQFPELVMALGFFDGIHKGHQQVIAKAKEEAHRLNCKSAVMTFNPHPSEVLGEKTGVRYITPIEDKIKIFELLNIDYLFVIHFNKEFASLAPEEFVEQYLVKLHVKHVVAGFDYSYGRFGLGTMETLPQYAKGRFTQTIIEKQSLDGEKVSSTRIRERLSEGDFETFFELVGRFYTIKGEVIHGEKRGRKLGFPTANIAVNDLFIFPSTGVYAVRIQIDGVWYVGVCNVGYKPTFHDEKPKYPSVEVHALDYNGDIYGNEVTVEWHKRLRSEKKFAGLDELISQIEADKQATIAYFKANE